MRRRATTGVDGTREVGFCFFFGGCSGVGGGFFHRLGSGQTRMPPQSDGTRGFWFRGILSHAQERRHEEVLVWGILSHARSLGTTQV